MRATREFLKISHIPYNNYLLSSQVEYMLTSSRLQGENLGLANIMDKVHGKMCEAKG